MGEACEKGGRHWVSVAIGVLALVVLPGCATSGLESDFRKGVARQDHRCHPGGAVEEISRHRIVGLRDAALESMLAQRDPDGGWYNVFDLYAFCGAVYCCMLRTTGLIDEPGARGDEVKVVRHMLTQVNGDGGFYKFPGSPSCKTVTRMAIVSLRLVLGEIPPGGRPASWYSANDGIGAGLEAQIRSTIDRAEDFLEMGVPLREDFERDHQLLHRLLVAHVDPREAFPFAPLLSPRLVAAAEAYGGRPSASFPMNRMVRRLLPALSILHRTGKDRGQGELATAGGLADWRPPRGADGGAIGGLVQLIRSQQNGNGGWHYNALYPMINLMALAAAGATPSDETVAKGYAHLRGRLVETSAGEFAVNLMDSDIWNTGHCVYSYLCTPGRSSCDEAILPAIEWLLANQGPAGGYAWGAGHGRDPDNDSTAFVLRALARAAETAHGDLREAIDEAMGRGLAYLLPRQNRQGGWSVWERTAVPGRPGSRGLISQVLFDPATADLTGRVLEGIAEAGFTTADEPVRRALRFLGKTQSRPGGWWCRWWAGYIPGTDMVLMAKARLGFRYGHVPPVPDDELVNAAHQRFMRGIEFLLSHQNPDGGWGETIASDWDERRAGHGASTPLLTAYTVSALLRCGLPPDGAAVRGGVRFLVEAADGEGRWHDTQSTFTIYARTFYYPYPFLTKVLPLDALNDYLRATGASDR